jgi:hypothetical protein
MNRRQSIIANPQPAKLVQPSDGPLHDPSGLAQLTAMRSSAMANLVSDPPALQGLPMRPTVVATIGLHTLRLAKWPPALARNGQDAIDQWHELRDIVAVGLGQNDVDRCALRVDEEVVLAARTAAIGWVRSTFFPPCSARTDELSAMTREKSSWLAPRRWASNTRCNRTQTPAFCQARKRRQQVIPEPHPISWGSISQGMPDCRTNKIPVNTWRSSRRLRPGYRLRRRGIGNNGSISCHSASSTSSRAISPPALDCLKSDMTALFSFC